MLSVHWTAQSPVYLVLVTPGSQLSAAAAFPQKKKERKEERKGQGADFDTVV